MLEARARADWRKVGGGTTIERDHAKEFKKFDAQAEKAAAKVFTVKSANTEKGTQ